MILDFVGPILSTITPKGSDPVIEDHPRGTKVDKTNSQKNSEIVNLMFRGEMDGEIDGDVDGEKNSEYRNKAKPLQGKGQ